MYSYICFICFRYWLFAYLVQIYYLLYFYKDTNFCLTCYFDLVSLSPYASTVLWQILFIYFSKFVVSVGKTQLRFTCIFRCNK